MRHYDQAAVATRDGADTAGMDVEAVREELRRERARRLSAEASATAARQHAAAVESRAAFDQWLVTVLRSELTCGRPKHWWQRLPWQQHD